MNRYLRNTLKVEKALFLTVEEYEEKELQ
ncbi:protein of unknown function [[Clostridium] ultunense Esp]|uniref:Uncharacterized protein n=1 Tax=[Clostridium] ultunense Esp TaxID=1288971 RepID=A0A1M4PSX8_9FIRM|nr:protein of unknown function [[Clostridium] ultunense Esp]